MDINLSGTPVDEVWLGSVQLFPPPAAGLPGLGDWADITATTGTVNKYEYTDAGGNDWTAYEWAVDGSVTTTEGLVDTFMVGGGGAHPSTSGPVGGAAMPIRAMRKLPAGKKTITVGEGGVTVGNDTQRTGKPSILGALKAYGGRYGFVEDLHITDDITGVSRNYGNSGRDGAAPNSGWGGNRGTGAFGIVVLRVPRAHAKA